MLRALLIVLFALPAVAQEPLPPGAIVRLGSARMRHAAEVGAIAYSPDGKVLAAVDVQGTIHLYDAANGRMLRRLQLVTEPAMETEVGDGPDGAVLCFSADGRHLHAGACQRVASFRVDDGEVVFRRRLRERLLAIGPDMTVAAVPGTLVLYQLDPMDGRIRNRHAIEGTSPPRAEVTVRGVLSSANVAVRLTDPASGVLRDLWFWREPGYLDGATMSPAGDTLALAIDTGKGRRSSFVLMDARQPQKYRTVALVSGAGPFAFAPDGKSIAVVCREGLLLLDATDGKMQRALEGAPRLKRLAFSPDGKFLAGASGGAIGQWDTATGRRLPASADSVGDVARLQFVDARRLRVFAGTIEDYDARTGALLKRYLVPPHANPAGDDVSPDGSLVAVCDKNALRLVDAATGRVRHDFTINGDEAAFSPDGTRLFVLGGDTHSQVVDTRTGRITRLAEHWAAGVAGSALSPDGQLLVGRRPSDDPAKPQSNVIRVWDSRTGRKVRDLGTSDDMSLPRFSTGPGRWVMVRSAMPGAEDLGQTGLLIWDANTGRLVRSLRRIHITMDRPTLSPDGWTMAFGGRDGTVHVWEIASGVERIACKGHHSPITALDFSPDGRYLASGSRDVPALVWDLFAPSPGPAPPAARLRADLADAKLAFAAMRHLVAAPDSAVALLGEHVRPAAPVNDERLRQLLTDLDDSRYPTRTAAESELRRIGDQAAARLALHAAASTTSAEARGRLRRLLDRADEPDPEFLARLRALEVLERLNTPAARKLIEDYAAGAPAARFTQEARVVLERVKCKTGQ